MAHFTHSTSQFQAKDDSKSANPNGATTSTPSLPDPTFSFPSSPPKLDHSFVNNSPVPPATGPERARISQAVVRGLHLLGLDMPLDATTRVAETFIDMSPMERFLAETCNIEQKVPGQDVAGGLKTSSCQANAGSFKSE